MPENKAVTANEPIVIFIYNSPKRRVQTGRGQECGRCDNGTCRRVAVLAATIQDEKPLFGLKPIHVTCCDRQECKKIAKDIALAQYADQSPFRR